MRRFKVLGSRGALGLRVSCGPAFHVDCLAVEVSMWCLRARG